METRGMQKREGDLVDVDSRDGEGRNKAARAVDQYRVVVPLREPHPHAQRDKILYDAKNSLFVQGKGWYGHILTRNHDRINCVDQSR